MADDRTVQQLFADPEAPAYPRHFRRGWIAQRAGWATLALFVLAGAAGFFGSGPLSSARVSNAGFTLEYERFVRREAPSKLLVRFAAPRPRAEVWLAKDWLEGVSIESMAPEAVAQRAEADRVVFAFDLSGPAAVTLRYRPTSFGRLRGRAGLAEGPALSFDQLAYP